MSTEKRILLTGASGFIGRHTFPELQRLNYEIHTISRNPAGKPPAGTVHHIADLFDEASTSQILRAIAPTHLMHLAWDVTPGKFWSSPANLDWVATSLRLYRAFTENGGRRAIFAGSFAEYDWASEILNEEDTLLEPKTLYGAAKCALHDLIARSAEQDGVSVAWARLFMLYGPYEREERLVPYIICSLLKGEPALCGAGDSERDFMHVSDAAQALVGVLNSDYQGAINIGSGKSVLLRDFMTSIAAFVGRPDLLYLGTRPAPQDDPLRLIASVKLLHGELGFRSRFTLTEGLADTVNWWRSELGKAGALYQRS